MLGLLIDTLLSISLSFARPRHLSLTCLNFIVRRFSSSLTLPLSMSGQTLASSGYYSQCRSDTTSTVVKAPLVCLAR